jgi:cell division septum initiation protein DivIVA
MGESSPDLQNILEQARKTQEDLDRKVFYLKTLFETSRELSGIIQPKRILDTFLLMAMGPLGVAHGMAALFSSKTGLGHVTARGISSTDADDVTRSLPLISSRYFPQEKLPEGSMPRVKLFAVESLSDHHLFPPEIRLLVFWNLIEDYSGFLGLGEKISGEPFDEGDTDLLLNLTNILMGTISQALSVLSIQQLNADLLKKNADLEAALGELRESRDELDRRIFHLKSLSDLNSELSPMFDMDDLLQRFIMTIMGPLGVRQGFVLVFDRESRLWKFSSRGLENRPTLDADAVEKLLYRSFDTLRNWSVAPMSVNPIADPSFFRQEGIGIDAALGFFFLVDQSFMGLVSLGPTIKGDSFSPEEVDLLTTQTSSFLVFLKNVKDFEIIQALNENLTRRNEELRQTIAELTEARYTITLLEKARIRIRSLIQNEAERIGRPSALDFLLVFLLAASIGVLFNFANPQGVPLLQESAMRPFAASVAPAEAKRMLEDRKRIKGAVNVPLALFDIMHMMKLGNLDPETPVIVYGRSISRLYDEELAFRLKQRDHDHVRVLSGGLRAWEAQGYPVQ